LIGFVPFYHRGGKDMDCRRVLFLPAVLAGAFGCVHTTVTPADPQGDPTAATVHKSNDSGKLTPKASTCVAFGTFSERCAADETRYTPVERDRLYDQARQAYQRALQIEPTDLAAQAALAHLYVNRSDLPRALEVYQKAVSDHPKEPGVWYELGLCQARNKQWEAALQNLRRAVELDPENRTRARSLGFCLARAGHIDESYAVFAKIDGEAMAHYHVARMLLHTKQDRLGEQHLRLALQLQPDLAPASALLASLQSGGAVQQTGADGADAFLGKP
jgi:Tfp pilus assembly protein PilF